MDALTEELHATWTVDISYDLHICVLFITPTINCQDHTFLDRLVFKHPINPKIRKNVLGSVAKSMKIVSSLLFLYMSLNFC